MFWTYDHEAILCREVVNVNPYTTKKGSTQRSSMWEKIADTLNKCSVPKFRVDKRSVRDHVGILVYKHKKKLQAEGKATGITQGTSSIKVQYDQAETHQQMKAMINRSVNKEVEMMLSNT